MARTEGTRVRFFSGVALLLCLIVFPGWSRAGAEDPAWVEEKLETAGRSWIEGGRYLRAPDAETGQLILQLHGESWTYFDVPVSTWERFRAADSLGRFFTREIKGRFNHQRGASPAVPELSLRPAPVSVLVQCAFNEECEAIILDRIRAATNTIRVAAYAFTRTRIAEALAAARARGVDVQMKIDAEQAAYETASRLMDYLERHGVSVTRIAMSGEYAAMHNKFMVIDGRYVMTGSYNYSTLAHVANWENLVLLESPQLATEFDLAWRGIRAR